MNQSIKHFKAIRLDPVWQTFLFYVSKMWFGKLTRNAFYLTSLQDTLTCLDVSSVIPLMRFPSLELVDSFAEPGWESKEKRLGRAVSVFSTTSLILEQKNNNNTISEWLLPVKPKIFKLPIYTQWHSITKSPVQHLERLY